VLRSALITDPARWNAPLAELPYAHILQSWEWGELKRQTTGWHPQRLAFYRGNELVAMASVGVRQAAGLKVMYASKGPALAYEDAELTAAVLDELQRRAQRMGAVWLKIDPDVIAATGVPAEPDDTPNPTGQQMIGQLQAHGWRYSADQPQFRNTITLDLTPSADDLLAALSQSTRRKVRTAPKKDVSIHPATLDDLPALYALYHETGARDGFLTRPLSYYQLAWSRFIEGGLAQPFIAEFEGRAIAHVILYKFGKRCWYFYGASGNEERQRMPNYALQWESILWAQSQGCTLYDFWGAPNVFDESDSMWGVYEFKRGFNGVVTRHIGAWDYAPYPPLYWGYTQVMPRVINYMRRQPQQD